MKVLKIILLFLSSFLLYTNVYATSDIKIENVKVTEKSSSMVVEDTSFEETTIHSKMEFHNLNDFVTYEVEIKNDSNKTYTLTKIIDHLNANYLTIESNDVGMTISKDEKKTIHVKVEYREELVNVESISPENSSLTLNFMDTSNPISNPYTLDIFVFILLIILFGTIIIRTILYYREMKKFLLILLFIPILVFAEEMLNINFHFDKVSIYGRFLSYRVQIDDGTGNVDDYTKTYGERVGELPVPEKTGYTFEGWLDQNDHVINSDTVVHENLNISASFELIHYTITYDLDGGEFVLANPDSYTVEDEFTLYNPVKEGYTFAGWITNTNHTLRTEYTIYKGTTGNIQFSAVYSANTDTVYTVIHKQMNLEGVYEETERETLHGATESVVSPQPIEYPGFKVPEAKTITILGNGTSTVTYLYEREKYSFLVNNKEDIETATEDGTYYYGTRVQVTAKAKPGYSFSWNDGSEEYHRSFLLEGNTSLTPSYEANTDTPYTVVHKQMDLDGEHYTLKDEYTFYGTTDSKVTPTTNIYEGFTAPEAEEITITGDGLANVTYLYTRNKYQLTIENDENVETTTPTGKYYYETSITLTAKDTSNEFIKWSNGETTKTITLELKEDTMIYPVYKEGEFDFNYTGGEQTFTAPATGYYQLEVWGAQGGTISTFKGGYGGYSSGSIFLHKGDILYINNGGEGIGATSAGQSLAGGYNGGGSVSGYSGVNHINASGGGATHIAVSSGKIQTFENKREELIIVAGGGGGARDQENHQTAARWGDGGSGGGANSSGSYSTNGTTTVSQQNTCIATQSVGPAFGASPTVGSNSGGGGGYYAGFHGEYSNPPVCVYLGAGSGGSGYIGNTNLITKHMVCYNCEPSYSESDFSISSTCHSKEPKSDCSKEGPGYTRITYLGTSNGNPEKIVLLKEKIDVKAGTTEYLIRDIHVQEGMTFTSSDENIATINASGLITAKKAGNTTITLSYQNYEITYPIRVLYADGTPYYFDVSNGVSCTESAYNSNSDKLGKTGCLKFYVIDDRGEDYIKLLLNHNTTGALAWNSTGSATSGPSLADGQLIKQLKADTDSWKGTRKLNDYKDPKYHYTVSYTDYKARILTYEEQKNMGGLIAYTNTGDKAWIFDNADHGYWTISAYNSSVAWTIDGAGSFEDNYVYHTIYFGIRPVIEINRPS